MQTYPDLQLCYHDDRTPQTPKTTVTTKIYIGLLLTRLTEKSIFLAFM